MASIAQIAARWLELDQDEATRGDIQTLLEHGDAQELGKRLFHRIAFGTAGLRSSMKAGFAHMNSLTVLQASHGLADYVTSQSKGPHSVVIGYDARHNSEKFARLTAAAFLSHGFTIYWFGDLVHTPLVPFTVLQRQASVGIMITASHNPKNDNGYKVYWSNGSQIIPPRDAGIAAMIQEVQAVDTWDEHAIDSNPNVQHVYHPTTKAYLAALRELVWPTPSAEMTMPFTYTPMHGVGLAFVRQAVCDIWSRGNNMRNVKEQAVPDPNFPTVSFPNPEEKGALDLAIQDADQNATTIILANDPDADRFAAVQKIDEETWYQFTGNETGILLASHVFETYRGDKSKLIMLASTVSSRMLSVMAETEGFHYRETLTGFKWLGNVAQDLKGQGFDPAFAFEEAIGYMFPSVVWDKDGVAALAVFLTAWQRWTMQGKTPMQKLQELYGKYGYFASANTYLISPSPEVTVSVFSDIRTLNGSTGRPQAVGQRSIARWRDLTTGVDTASPGGVPDLPVDSTSQMITCELENVVFTARGSGTEPKIKLYIEAKASSMTEAQSIADEVLADLLKEWFKPEYNLKLAGT